MMNDDDVVVAMPTLQSRTTFRRERSRRLMTCHSRKNVLENGESGANEHLPESRGSTCVCSTSSSTPLPGRSGGFPRCCGLMCKLTLSSLKRRRERRSRSRRTVDEQHTGPLGLSRSPSSLLLGLSQGKRSHVDYYVGSFRSLSSPQESENNIPFRRVRSSRLRLSTREELSTTTGSRFFPSVFLLLKSSRRRHDPPG